LPINAVQFTILSIIATAYKLVDEFDYTTASLLKLFFWDNAIIDKTLFYVNRNSAFRAALKDIFNIFGL
jgi:hypothetical protein